MSRQRVRRVLCAMAGAAAVAGCSNTITSDARSSALGATRVTASVGQELDLTLRTIGPGPTFDTVPSVSSSAVRFVNAGYAADQVPGGPTQLFRFTADRPGIAIVTFTKPGGAPVTDEIDVH